MTVAPNQQDGTTDPLDIMIPYWGDPDYLRQAVRSVLAQTSPDWRLTVVDDAYPDDWAGDYLASLGDPRVRYVRNPTNQGITATFRQCAQLATSELVAIPGCDDLLFPDYVDVVLGVHRAFPRVDIIQPGVKVIDQQGNDVRTLVDGVKQRVMMPRESAPRVFSGEALAVSLLRGDWLYWPSLVFRRERLAATPFRDGLPIIQDLALVIDMVCAGAQLLVVPTRCFAYRRHDESASSVKLLDGSRFNGEREYFDLAYQLVSALGWQRAARAARHHLTSRAHALTLLPLAVKRRDGAAAQVLLRHVTRP